MVVMQLLCPRCGDMFEHPLQSALSRYHEGVRICSACGHNEAMYGDCWTTGTIVERLRQECAEREQECTDYAAQLSRLQGELTQMRVGLKNIQQDRAELRRQVRQLTAAVEGLASFDPHRPIEERLEELLGKIVELEVRGGSYVGTLTRCGSSWRLPTKIITCIEDIYDVQEIMEA